MFIILQLASSSVSSVIHRVTNQTELNESVTTNESDFVFVYLADNISVDTLINSNVKNVHIIGG